MKPTPPLQKALRRLPLTTKQGPHNYYKGNRTGSQGSINKHGVFKADRNKIRTYICPDLRDFKLTPFVSKRVEPEGYDGFEGKGPLDGKLYLRRWKEVPGHVEHGQEGMAAKWEDVKTEVATEAEEEKDLMSGESERKIDRQVVDKESVEQVVAREDQEKKGMSGEEKSEKAGRGLLGWFRR